MTRPRVLAPCLAGGLLSVLVLLLVGGLASAADEEEPTGRLLQIVKRDKDPASFADAVARLKNGSEEQRERVFDLLRKMAAERRKKVVEATEKIDELAERVGDGRKADTKRQTWDEAKREAEDWLFDVVRFPDPPLNAVITGPYEGYAEAKRRGGAAAAAWKSLTRALDRALAPAFRLTEKKARDLETTWTSRAVALRRVVEQLPAGERSVYAPPAKDELADLLLGLALGRFGPAAEAYASQGPSWRKLCLFYAWSHAVLATNERNTYGMSETAVEGIRSMNEYRLALGISPMRHDARLVRAARRHADDMVRYRFFSHKSPRKGRETKEKRVAEEGYEGDVVECIRGDGGARSAVEFWKFDGAHHRYMISPEIVDAGMGTLGPAVYVGGKGDAKSLPGLRY